MQTRKPVEVKPPQVTPPETGENIGVFGTVYPTEGATFNGIKVTRDADTGILGLDLANKVYGGIYTGIDVIRADGSTYEIKEGTIAGDTLDNMQSGDAYVTRNGYTFWGEEFSIMARYAQSRLPAASKALAGKTADIKGNTNSSAPPFYKCVMNEALGTYQWKDIDKLLPYQK